MTVLFSDSYDAMEAWKENLKTIDIRKYPAEDVGKCCTDITILSERLDSAGHFEPDLLVSICKIFEGTSCKRFELWAIQNTNNCQAFVRKLRVNELIAIPEAERPPTSLYARMQRPSTALSLILGAMDLPRRPLRPLGNLICHMVWCQPLRKQLQHL